MEDLVGFIVGGATREMENLVGRVHGPMSFRLIIQPLMAVVFAVRDGRKDAQEGKAPYLWALFTNPAHRRELLREGWKSVGKIFVIALVLDAVYQFITVRWFYPGEALVVAVVLALVPYLVLRGPVNRLWPPKGAVNDCGCRTGREVSRQAGRAVTRKRGRVTRDEGERDT
jgi:hypothetical protein